MAGRHPFQQLRDRLSPDAQREASALTDAMEQELSLAELRRARAMTQEQLGSDLHVGQASIAKLERRTDMYLSTLRRFVEAMGGELDIVVRFPDQPQVRLRGIGELGEGARAAAVPQLLSSFRVAAQARGVCGTHPHPSRPGLTHPSAGGTMRLVPASARHSQNVVNDCQCNKAGDR